MPADKLSRKRVDSPPIFVSELHRLEDALEEFARGPEARELWKEREEDARSNARVTTGRAANVPATNSLWILWKSF
jgi:hypothetical protein